MDRVGVRLRVSVRVNFLRDSFSVLRPQHHSMLTSAGRVDPSPKLGRYVVSGPSQFDDFRDYF